MKTINLNEIKARKNGTVTPASLVEGLEKAISDGKIKKIVYITVDEKDEIRCGWSNMRNTELVGLLEIGKQNVINEISE